MTVQKIATVRCLGTASEQAPIRRSKAADVLKAAWPRDTLAASVLKAATTPTADFPATERVLTLPNIAPASAALKLFAQGLALDLTGVATVKVPRVDAPPVGVFVGEGKPAPALQLLTGASSIGPPRKFCC